MLRPPDIFIIFLDLKKGGKVTTNWGTKPWKPHQPYSPHEHFWLCKGSSSYACGSNGNRLPFYGRK